jgi:starvation-inducible DNA-binding protein
MLIDELKKVHADAFTFYLKAHYYHWNVEGPNFPQYHDFLQNLYQEVFASIDSLAELIRTLDSYAPGTLTRLKELTSIEETDDVPDGKTMMTRLLQENNILRASLLTAYTTADTTGEVGISNFLQDRIQAHEKHSWMLRSILK